MKNYNKVFLFFLFFLGIVFYYERFKKIFIELIIESNGI